MAATNAIQHQQRLDRFWLLWARISCSWASAVCCAVVKTLDSMSNSCAPWSFTNTAKSWKHLIHLAYLLLNLSYALITLLYQGLVVINHVVELQHLLLVLLPGQQGLLLLLL